MIENLQMVAEDSGKKRKLGQKLSEDVYNTLFEEEEVTSVNPSKITKTSTSSTSTTNIFSKSTSNITFLPDDDELD